MFYILHKNINQEHELIHLDAESQTNAIVAWPSLIIALERNHSGNPDNGSRKKS